MGWIGSPNAGARKNGQAPGRAFARFALKEALKTIIADYNARYGTNHAIGEFDAYYQDVQKRIKDQQYPNRDLPKKGAEKIDITIVVDMLLTGFDAKYLNTLYVDKNLKHHGLIQAFSRTNRVLNAAKPYGHILDFRGQQDKVDEAITLFSGARAEQAKEIWLVDKAPVVIEQLKAARQKLDDFLQSQGLDPRPEAVPNLKGDAARVAFVKQFKEIQRLTTQLDQYTDLTDEQRREIDQTLPKDDARAFRGVYLETAKRLKAKQDKTGSETPGFDNQVCETPDTEYGSDAIDQLDFEFVLFASADIDYDYIMNLIARFSGQTPSQQEMSREQLIRLIRSDAKFMDELDEITEYVRTLETGTPLTEEEVRNGYQRFKDERHAAELAAVADKHGLRKEALQEFVDAILDRMIFDGEQLTDLMEPLGLGWRERREKELALMDKLVPLLKKRATGRTISGLNAYEQYYIGRKIVESTQIQMMTGTFEGHAQQTDNGVEYWLARDLQQLLGYTEWRNFLNTVTKAKTACEVSGHAVDNHFVDVNKMVECRLTSTEKKALKNPDKLETAGQK